MTILFQSKMYCRIDDLYSKDNEQWQRASAIDPLTLKVQKHNDLLILFWIWRAFI